MKYITEMTEEEILKLDQVDLDRMIRYKMAEEGIKILPRPEEPTYREVPGPDLEVFYCGLFDSTYRCGSAEEVRELVKLFEQGTSYTVTNNYSLDLNWAKPGVSEKYSDPRMVQSKMVYSEGLYDSCKEVLTENKGLKSAYDEEMSAYKAALDEASWIREEITDVYREARSNENMRQTMYGRYKEYLSLAEDNREVAVNFLKKAYHEECSDEMLTYIKERHEAEEEEKY